MAGDTLRELDAVVANVKAAKRHSSERIAPCGTTWVLHPIYSQVLFAYNRVAATASQHPEWKATAPFN
jgi:hypothetical protein